MNMQSIIQQCDVQPRPYQERIISRAVESFCDKDMRSILIESPTGSGKTVMGLLIARTMQERLGIKVGWIAMRRYLLGQAAEENRQRKINVEAEFISMFEKNPPRNLDLLVVDEAQHDAAQSMATLHQAIRPRFILGLSATPFRADKVKLCFDTVIKDAGIHSLIQDGYLSQYQHFTIPTHTPELVVEHFTKEPERWGKSIFYFHTIDQCETADRLLKQAGFRSEVVTGSSNRDAQLEAFRAGKVDVLSNCMVLSEGFDCPELKTVFCRPSCKGVTIQMGGRVLRRHPEVQIKNIVQCRKTRWPFPRTATPEVQYVWMNEEWRSLKANPMLNEVNQRVLRALANSNVQLPKMLQRRSSSFRRDYDAIEQ